jgi:Putative DNA-binding domain
VVIVLGWSGDAVLTYELLSSLRYKTEGTDVDFKGAQYRFVGGGDDEKSEMLKDILAIANAWREGPGYILLGFKDRRPHPAEVVGISESIDDAKLQQFVNSKVRPKLTFHYEEHLYDGMTVGVITIPKQKRPFFLGSPFGKLKKNIVYVRRGSSTDEAEPTEVTDMGLADAGRGRVRLDMSVLTRKNEDLPNTFSLTFLRFPEVLPDYESPPPSRGPFEFRLPSMWRDNTHFWRQYAKYARLNAALIEMKFVLRNRSEMQLSNAKLEVSAEALEGQRLHLLAGSDLPEAPNRQWSEIHGLRSLPEVLDRREARLIVDEGGVVPTCHVRFGSLLPGEEGRSSDTLAIVPSDPGKLRLRFRILAGEIPEPQEEERILETTGKVVRLDVDGLNNWHMTHGNSGSRRSRSQ